MAGSSKIQYDPLSDRAEGLVSVVHAWAVDLSNDPRAGGAECFKLVGDRDFERWDFFVIVATVFIAIHGLALFESSRATRLSKIVAIEFDARFPKVGNAAYADCQAFFDRTHKALMDEATEEQRKFAASDTVGAWIMCNLLDHWPETAEERQMIRALGIVASQFAGWWTETTS